MVPDFQPFKHPAKNVESPSKTLKSGPISDVEWVEEVVPVFGKINKLEKKEKEGQGGSSAFLFCGFFGCIIAGAVYRKNSDHDIKENRTEKKADSQNQLKIDNKIKSTKDFKKDKSKIEPESKILDVKIYPTKAEKETDTDHVTKHVEVKSAEKIPELKTVVIKAEVIDSEQNANEKVKSASSNTINNTQVQKAEKPVKKVVNDKVKETKAKVSETPINKRKLSQATLANVEDPEWITKIKTFKITKVPKQNTADISEHGAVQYAVDILDNVEVEKAEDMKTTIRTTTADTDIEGANISRLRITVVVDKNEEESLSKTMTMKEFMVSMSNQIIEDAVARVKENCSMENIKHLAETIKKYRPESADIKKGKSL